MKNLFKRRSPIGLDIGANCVKAVQSVRSRTGWKIAACTRFSRSTPNAALTAAELIEVKAVLRRQGFTGDQVVSTPTSDKLLTGALELPARRADVPMDQIARAEFARIHKCDLAAAEFSWWELPVPARGGKGTHVMAVAYPHAAAMSQLEVFDQAGFHVTALQTPTAVLARSCVANGGGNGTVAALDIGWQGVALVLLSDGVVCYERRIASGGLSKLHAVLASRLRLDAPAVEQVVQEIGLSGEIQPEIGEIAAEARPVITAHLDQIVEEVRKACGYASHQYPTAPVGLLMIAGGGACITGAIEHFGTALKMQAHSLEPLPNAAGDPKSHGKSTPSHASASALAMFTH